MKNVFRVQKNSRIGLALLILSEGTAAISTPNSIPKWWMKIYLLQSCALYTTVLWSKTSKPSMSPRKIRTAGSTNDAFKSNTVESNILCIMHNYFGRTVFKLGWQLLAAVFIINLTVQTGGALFQQCYQLILRGIGGSEWAHFGSLGKFLTRHQLAIHEINFPQLSLNETLQWLSNTRWTEQWKENNGGLIMVDGMKTCYQVSTGSHDIWLF